MLRWVAGLKAHLPPACSGCSVMACMNHGMAQMTDSLDLHAALRKGVKEYRAVCSEHYQYVLFQDGEHSLYLIGNTHI
jgi:hypothetical protein